MTEPKPTHHGDAEPRANGAQLRDIFAAWGDPQLVDEKFAADVAAVRAIATAEADSDPQFD